MKKVYFIGFGYEVVAFRLFDENTPNGEAFAKAEEWYKATGQTFYYMALEIGL